LTPEVIWLTLYRIPDIGLVAIPLALNREAAGGFGETPKEDVMVKIAGASATEPGRQR
jgi:hypothetical protein